MPSTLCVPDPLQPCAVTSAAWPLALSQVFSGLPAPGLTTCGKSKSSSCHSHEELQPVSSPEVGNVRQRRGGSCDAGSGPAPLSGARIRQSVTGAISHSISVIAWHNFSQVKSRKMAVLHQKTGDSSRELSDSRTRSDLFPSRPCQPAPPQAAQEGQQKKETKSNYLVVSHLHAPFIYFRLCPPWVRCWSRTRELLRGVHGP